MSLAARKQYQNTTVRLPRQVYERAKTVVIRSQASSFNEFVVQAIEDSSLMPSPSRSAGLEGRRVGTPPFFEEDDYNTDDSPRLAACPAGFFV